MIEVYTRKDGEIKVGKYFKAKEFFCSCGKCNNQLIDIKLIQTLDLLRVILGPIKINSAYRCEAHNKDIKGSEDSQHCKGKAADIVATNSTLEETRKQMELIGVGGLGKYDTFTHIDVREGKARW